MIRRYFPYILVFVILAILALLIVSNSKSTPGKLDERITLRQRDKIPYGTAAARSLLPGLFPDAIISTDNKSPGDWDEIIPTSYDQAVFLVTSHLNADEYELAEMLSFIERGNFIFIIERSFSDDAEKIFQISVAQNAFDELMGSPQDSLMVKLESPPFDKPSQYLYPGKKYQSWFQTVDPKRSLVLGRDEEGRPNFIRMSRGSGAVFIHTAPLAFSNYFLLHRENIAFMEKAFSVIPGNMEKVVWNEYYLTKPSRQNRADKPGWLRVLFRYPPFKWGLITAMATMLLLVLLGMRRRQRMIPVHQLPKNDSLDFVKTMGRLYHDRRDHGNLAKKMSVYFLDHIRSQYKLSTQELDEPFIQALHYKSGYSETGIREIVSFVIYLRHQPPVTEAQLYSFHQQLERFYQNT